tara:strand:- start:3329 stop:5851 length:2523 start_codon:yes stop_codon:yes gene_type:complete
MGENLVAGILKNIETLANVNANQNVAILTGIKKTNTLLSDQIGKELSKQTKLLESILDAFAKGTSSNSFSIFGSSGTKSFAKMFKKGGGKALQAMALGMDKFADATKKFVDAVNELDEKKFDKFVMLFDMGKKILLFSLSIVIAIPFLIVGLLAILILKLWVNFFKFLAEKTKDLKKGAKALLFISGAILGIVLSIAIAGLILSKLGFGPVLLVIGTLLAVAIAFSMISAVDKSAKSGAKSMIFLALTVGIVIGLIVLSKFIMDKITIGGVLLVFGVLVGIALVFMLIGLVKSKTNKGAMSMIFLAIATAIIVGILIFITKISLKRFAAAALMVGVIMIGLAIVFVIAGALKGQILGGALAMLLVSAVVAVITFSLIKFQEANVTGTSVAILSAFIVGMGVAFGVAGLAAPFILAGGAAMLVVAGAIFVFTASLGNFSKAEWTEDKTEILSGAIVSLVTAIKDAFSDFGLADFARMFAGVKLLSNLGNALSAFAQGIGSFANLELSEVVQEGEGENAKFTVKTKGAINPAAISSNIALLLQEVTKPLKDFGAENSDGGGWFSEGNLGTGIGLLGKLGNALGSFALGMSFFGNMKVVEFDDKGKVVPGSEKGIDIGKIGTGITTMLNALTDPLTKLGENGDIEDGIEYLGTLASPMESFANAISTLSKVKIDSAKLEETFTKPLTSIIKTFTDSDFEKMDEDKVENLFEGIESFAESVEKMKGSASKDIGKMFVDMKESINGMNLPKLTKLNSLAENLAKFAEAMDGSFGDLEAVLEKLKDAIAEMNGIEISSAGTTTAGPVTQTQEKIDLGPLLSELEEVTSTLRSGLDVNVTNSINVSS